MVALCTMNVYRSVFSREPGAYLASLLVLAFRQAE